MDQDEFNQRMAGWYAYQFKLGCPILVLLFLLSFLYHLFIGE